MVSGIILISLLITITISLIQKLGLSFQKNEWSGYLSYSLGQKEPNRDDFEAGLDQQPKPEKLNDLELGIEKRNDKYNIGLTGYYMHYEDQLVLTGKINDVGAYTRTNIPKSYRAGLELVASCKNYFMVKCSRKFFSK